MGVEEDAIDQASSARRERLKALRAAKELLSTPDSDLPSGAPGQENRDVTNGGEKPEETNDERSPTQAPSRLLFSFQSTPLLLPSKCRFLLPSQARLRPPHPMSCSIHSVSSTQTSVESGKRFLYIPK